MLSSCFGSLDIRSPGVFTETFLDHYHLDICKSNAKTFKIISINRFGITCCYFSSRNILAIALCCDISVELSPFAVKSMFWLRSWPITLQEITYPDLVVARTVGEQFLLSSFRKILHDGYFLATVARFANQKWRNYRWVEKRFVYAISKSSSICTEKILFLTDYNVS